jgi:hypothetical protein
MDTAAATRIPRQRGADEGQDDAHQARGGHPQELAFTPEDQQRERRIELLQAQLIAARTPELRRLKLQDLEREIKARSANAIAVIEADKGLV